MACTRRMHALHITYRKQHMHNVDNITQQKNRVAPHMSVYILYIYGWNNVCLCIIVILQNYNVVLYTKYAMHII